MQNLNKIIKTNRIINLDLIILKIKDKNIRKKLINTKEIIIENDYVFFNLSFPK